MVLNIILISCVIILSIILVFQHTKMVIAKRRRYELARSIAKEREATADILTLSRDVITSGTSDQAFLTQFVEYALRTMKGTGAAVLQCGDDGRFCGCAVSGTFPPIKKLPHQVAQQLMAHAKKHTEYIRGVTLEFKDTEFEKECDNGKGFVFFANSSPNWLPDDFHRDAKRILMAPVYIQDKMHSCVIVTSDDSFDSPTFSEQDGFYLLRLSEIASLSLEVIRVFRDRQEYEERLQSAREEGMSQVSTGIIHNIGNAITVAKLSVSELKERISKERSERPETLILDEVLPRIKQEVTDGKVGEFLTSDPVGSQYVDIIAELLSHSNTQADESSKLLESLTNKLRHISDIIELQQRFVGELGTENMTQLANVIESAIKIFEESFNKRGVSIETDIGGSVPEVLIDSSMMTQVYMNVIKNAVEAIEAESDEGKGYKLKVTLAAEPSKDDPQKNMAVVTIEDNGPGIDEDVKAHIFEFGFSTKGKSRTRGYGLHSCLDTVKKYGGYIDVQTALGNGTTFKIALPISEAAN